MSLLDIEAREKFLYTLEWLLAVTRRYSGQLQFALAHIDYGNPRLLGEAYGAQQAAQKLDEVVHVMREAFRKTDLVTRDGTDVWILLPYTPATEKLSDKLRYIIDVASQGGLQIVERDISLFSLPYDKVAPGAEDSALAFLHYLKKNHTALAQAEVVLPASE